MARSNQTNLLYSIEVLKIGKPTGILTHSISEDRRNYVPQVGFTEKLEQLYDAVKGQDT